MGVSAEQSSPGERAAPGAAAKWLVAARRVVGRQGRIRTVVVLYFLVALLLFCARYVHSGYASWSFVWTMVALASFTIVAGYAQAIVVLSGGIDLAIPGVITVAGVLLAQWSAGSDSRLVYVLPAVVGVGIGVGVVNGLFVTALRQPPLVVTLAMNVILTGVALVVTSGTPQGSAPHAVVRVMQADIIGRFPLVIPYLVAFVAAGVFALQKTTFGRAVYAIGTNRVTAYFSGVPVSAVLIGVYALGGACSALVGVMLTGYSGQPYLGMGDNYLLLSLAAVVVGGIAVSGGRGLYLGVVAAALLLTTMSTLLQASALPNSVQQMAYAVAILCAVGLGVVERARRARGRRKQSPPRPDPVGNRPDV